MSAENALDRRAVTARLLSRRGDAVVISGLGAPTYDVAAAGDHERNFYLWGAMGAAAMMGLGLALAQPHVRVIVITGDGEALMGLGAFATIGLQNPANLTIIILDNERYGETGGQQSHTAGRVDLSAVAKACGFTSTAVITRLDEVEALADRLHEPTAGSRLITIKVDPAEAERVLPSRDGVLLKLRLRRALGCD